jgi:hypothetical protein
MSKPKLGLSRKDFQDTLDMTNTIITAMTGNATFGTPNPTLAATTTLKNTAATKLAAYNTALAALDTAMSDRDAAFDNLRAALTQLANYVDNVANGDKVKIESAGMPVRNDSAPVGELAEIEDLVLEPSKFDGKLDASWGPIRGADSYQIQISVDPLTPSAWALFDSCNTASVTLEGLTSGTKQWVRVRAVGADNGKAPWSDPAGKTVP